MSLSIPDDPFQQPAQQVSSEEHDSMTTMQHSIKSTTLASEHNAMGFTNTNAAHDAHGSTLSTSRGYHGDKVLEGTQEDSERRIDFISQLPAELAIGKLIPMLMDNDRLDAPYYVRICTCPNYGVIVLFSVWVDYGFRFLGNKNIKGARNSSG